MIEDQLRALAIVNFVFFALSIEAAIRMTRYRAQGRPIGWSDEAGRFTLLFLRIGAIGSVLTGLLFLNTLSLLLFITPAELEEVARQSNLDPEEIRPGPMAWVLGIGWLMSLISVAIQMFARRRKQGEIVGLALYIIPVQSGIYALSLLLVGASFQIMLGAIVMGLAYLLMRWANAVFVRVVR